MLDSSNERAAFGPLAEALQLKFGFTVMVTKFIATWLYFEVNSFALLPFFIFVHATNILCAAK